MLDRERLLAKIDHLDGYQRELRQILPATFADYHTNVEKRRACERLLQLIVECMLDMCALLVAGLRLGLPSEQDDLFEKLEQAKVLNPELTRVLRSMKGFRNILVHQYGGLDNALVYKVATTRLQDVEAFRSAVLSLLQEKTSGS